MKKNNSQYWEFNTIFNKNISFLHSSGFWATYVGALILIRFVLSLLPITTGTGWTILNLAHATLSWFWLHWQKGVPFASPMEEQQGKFASMTMWEQLDLGVQYTPTRKFFIIIPIALFIVTVHYNEYRTPWVFWLNFAAFLVLLVSKLPSMHGVRLFGINKE